MIVTSRAPVRIDFAGGWTDVDVFARGAGGAVLNASINQYVTGRLETFEDAEEAQRAQGQGEREGMSVAYGFDLPTGSGLGTSSALNVVWLSLILCYTGKPRLSGNIHENVWSAFRRGVPETVNALYDLRNVAIRMKTVLAAGGLEEFGTLLSQNWKHQKALDPSVTNGLIEDLFATALGAGAVDGKACGAGGGGCLLFYAPPERRQAVAGALAAAGARVIPFQFEFEGLTVQTH